MLIVGLLRKFLVFIISTIFVMLLVLTTVSFSFAEITKPANSKTLLLSVLSLAMPKDVGSDAMHNQILYDCENKIELQLPIDDGSDSVTINCNDIRDNKPLNEVLLDGLFDKVYYKDYGCRFLQCFEKNSKDEPPFFLFAKVANDFFQNLSTKVVIAAIIMGVTLLLLGGIRTVAKNLITAGLPFIIILLTRNQGMQLLSSKAEFQPLLSLITSLDAATTRIFAAFLITGIILFVIALVFKKRAGKPKAKIEKIIKAAKGRQSKPKARKRKK